MDKVYTQYQHNTCDLNEVYLYVRKETSLLINTKTFIHILHSSWFCCRSAIYLTNVTCYIWLFLTPFYSTLSAGRPPPLSLHPCIPPSLSPSRLCIPIPHTVAVSLGESCLPSATGPTKRCCSRASPHRPEARKTHRREHVHTGNLCFLRSSDFGKSSPMLIMEIRDIYVSTCQLVFVHFPVYPFNCPPWLLQWGSSELS